MTIDEMIAVLQAAKAARQIERVKPGPREWYIHEASKEHPDGSVNTWQCPRCIKVREVLE